MKISAVLVVSAMKRRNEASAINEKINEKKRINNKANDNTYKTLGNNI